MYELFDGVLAIIGGIYCYLTAIGKVKLKKSEEQSIAWRAKYGNFMKGLGLVIFCFGIYKLYQYFSIGAV